MTLRQKMFAALLLVAVILTCVWVIGERFEMQRQEVCSTPHSNGDPRYEEVCQEKEGAHART